MLCTCISSNFFYQCPVFCPYKFFVSSFLCMSVLFFIKSCEKLWWTYAYGMWKGRGRGYIISSGLPLSHNLPPPHSLAQFVYITGIHTYTYCKMFSVHTQENRKPFFYSVRLLTWKYVCLDRVTGHGILRYELVNKEDLFHTKE
jgi:hypothetical protein